MVLARAADTAGPHEEWTARVFSPTYDLGAVARASLSSGGPGVYWVLQVGLWRFVRSRLLPLAHWRVTAGWLGQLDSA